MSGHKKTKTATSGSETKAHDTAKEAGVMPARRRTISPSLMWALLFTGGIGVWALTGDIKGGAALKVQQDAPAQKNELSLNESDNKLSTKKPVKLFQVRTAVFNKQRYGAKLIIRGRTYSDTQVDVRAETPGAVIKLLVEKGDFVEKGTLLCQLEDGGRRAALLEATAMVAQAKGDYEASKKLKRSGHTAGLRVLQHKALYDRAVAQLERAKLDSERTKIRAPFKGYVEKLPSKVGSLLAIGEHCSTLVALDPLHVVGAVRERDVQKIKSGMEGTAKLITGESAKGTIEFIAAMAEPETRTFRVELVIPNPNGRLRGGVTADIELPLAERDALLLPPSILALDDHGVIGVRVVNGAKKVEFWPVKIISEQKQGIWIEAFPFEANIITVGADFVKEGQSVESVPDKKFAGQPGS